MQDKTREQLHAMDKEELIKLILEEQLRKLTTEQLIKRLVCERDETRGKAGYIPFTDGGIL